MRNMNPTTAKPPGSRMGTAMKVQNSNTIKKQVINL